MPRTKLDKYSKEGHRKSVERVLKQAMIRNDIPSQKCLGEYIGLSEHQINYRFKTGFKDQELFELGCILHFTEADRIAILGGD